MARVKQELGDDELSSQGKIVDIDKSASGNGGREKGNNQKFDRRAVGAHQIRQPSIKMVGDIVAFADFLIILLMSVVAKFAYVDSILLSQQNIEIYVGAGLVGSVVFLIHSRWRNSYSFSTLSEFGGQMRRIAAALGVTAFVLLGIAYLVKASADYSRGWMTVWFVLNFLMLSLEKFIVSRILHRWISFGVFARRIVVYGSGDIAKKIVEHLGQNFLRTRVCGVFDDLVESATPKVILAGGLPELLRFGQTEQVDEVLIALPLSEERRIVRLVSELSILPVDIRLCPDMAAFALRPTGIVYHGNIAVLELEQRPLDGWGPVFKAIEDRAIGGIMFLAALPVFFLVAAAIKLDSSGPVFFRQRRHGFNHNIFMVWKFRTMTVAEDGATVVQAQRDDQRVTRVGKWLRRASLDELPQLFNVLGGEMSLVGPRPHAIAHNEHYSLLLGTYASRHKVRPGITGWAQVNGYRGETDTPEKMAKRVECDLYYIRHWSLWFDIKILLLTPFSLFSKNAF